MNKILRMNNVRKMLKDTASQLLAIESLLGCDFIPANENPLKGIKLPSSSGTAQVPQTDELSANEKTSALEALRVKEVEGCTKCRLSQGRTNIVFAEGSADAKLVFVGEGPGRDEDIQGKPFVGRAGELLTKMITAMGLTRQDVYICNMVKCRPPENRTPMPDEVAECWPYLMKQLSIIRPQVIVTLGNPATQGLLQTKIGITKLRGTWQKLQDIAPGLEGTPVMPTFHPAYVLRNYSVDTRTKVWSDLQQVMNLLDLKLPEKK